MFIKHLSATAILGAVIFVTTLCQAAANAISGINKVKKLLG
jgi:uncharacterized protein YegP (UPF0339 family)